MRALPAIRLAIAVLGIATAAPDLAVADDVVVRNLTVTDGTVSGDIVNMSHHLVRDVRLLVRQTWSWQSRRSLRENSPGWAAYPTVHRGDILPGASRSFTVHVGPPVPVRSDERFETAVEVVGFTEMDE